MYCIVLQTHRKKPATTGSLEAILLLENTKILLRQVKNFLASRTKICFRNVLPQFSHHESDVDWFPMLIQNVYQQRRSAMADGEVEEEDTRTTSRPQKREKELEK